MKKQVLFGILLIMFAVTPSQGQEKTDYSTVALDGLNDCSSISSSYWMGNTYAFFNEGGEDNAILGYDIYDISESGSIHHGGEFFLNYELPYTFTVASCVFEKDLFVFYWLEDPQPTINYYVKMYNQEFEHHSIEIDEHISAQMAALSFNDTLYIFFTDDADHKVKYYSCVADESGSNLVLVDDTPVNIDDNLTSIGNVAAISYVNDNLEDEVVVAFPGETDSKGNNKINIFIGKPGHFELYAQKPSVNNYYVEQISMAQGSVKGGFIQSYCIHFGYSVVNSSNHGPVSCELNMKTGEFSDWESLDWGGYLEQSYTWFMEFYTKQTQKREKYLVQGYNHGSGNFGAQWKSDILAYQDQVSEVPPMSVAGDYFDIILVTEGAPPYALNGYKLSDPGFSNNPLSEFSFTNATEESVSATTTYTQSIEENMGVGPVTAGFKASFMESSGTTCTETVNITESISPPLSDLDSCGLMWYYYIAPTVVRSRWAMQDYNGNYIEPRRNLFFFNFNNPQLKTMLVSLSDYGDLSPRAYNLESYENRGVENMTGVEEILRNETDINIMAGGSGSLELTFSQSSTDSYSKSLEVSLGIDAEYGIFSASASASAGVEYTSERTTTCSNTFYINWNLFTPKYPEDTSNVRSFTPVSYVMKTTDSTAYFLPDSMNQFRPYFITYEVEDINHGDYLFSIDEDVLYSKYGFSNFPVPCNDYTNFSYTLPDDAFVMLEVYDAYGSTVKSICRQLQFPGHFTEKINTSELKNGMYFYVLQIGNDKLNGKFILKR